MTAVVFRVRSVLRRRWKSTLGVTLVVVAGGALALTLSAGAVRTLTAPDRYVESLGLTLDIGIEQVNGPPRTDEVRALPAVASAESVTFIFGGLVPAHDGTGGAVDSVGAFGYLDGLVFAGGPEALGSRVVEGRAADPSKVGEFVASRSFADNARAELGDRFILRTISIEQAAASGFDVAEPGGPVFEVTLVGVFDGSATLQDDYPASLFPPTILDGADIGVSASQMAVALAAAANVDDLRAQLDGLPNGNVFAIRALEVVPDAVRAAIRTQGIGLVILALTVSAAAIAVTGQLLGREVRLPETQRSALRTLGMTENQLRVEALATAAVPVVIGVVFGATVSVAFSRMFPVGFARQTEPHPGVRFEPIVHLLGPFLLMAALLGWLGLGLIRSRSRSRLRASRTADLSSRVYPLHAATALRFMFSPRRDDAGSAGGQVAGLVVVLMLAIGAMTFGANIARLLDEPARQGRAELGLGAGGGEIPEEIRHRLAADPDVVALTMFGAVVVFAGSDSLDVAGALPLLGDDPPAVLEGRLPVADDEIALGRVAARRLGVGVSDDFEVAGATGVRMLRVTGFAVIPGVAGGDGLGEGGYMSLAGVRTLDPAVPVSVGVLQLRDGAPHGTAQRLSELVGMGIGSLDPPGEIINLGRVRSIPFVLVAVLGLLAILSLAHQLLHSIRQHRNDVAILRALGATRGWVTAVVHWQAILLTLLVFAVATPFGFILGQATYRVVVDRLGAQTDTMVPVLPLAAVLVALTVFANAAAAVPSRQVRKMPPAGYLNHE